MKNSYSNQHNYWYPFALIWLISLRFSCSSLAQTPVIQWQRVIEPSTSGAASGRSFIVQNSTGGYSVVTADRRLVSLSTAGEVLSDVPLNGVSSAGTTSEALSTVSPIATPDNAVVVAVLDNQQWALQKRKTTGEISWNSGLSFSVSTQYEYSVSSIVSSSDGGFLACATRYDRTYADPFAPIATYVILTKLSSTGYLLWQKNLRYSTFDAGLEYYNGTRVNKAISTSDGGFLLVGTANPTSSNSTLRGWAARLNSEGNVVWQKRYEQMNDLNDVAVAPATNNAESYLLNGYALPATPGVYGSSTLRVDAQGNAIQPSVQVPYPAGISLASVALLPLQARPALYVVGNDTPMDNNKGDIRLTGFTEQGSVAWTKVLGGSGRDYGYMPSLLPVPDGILVAGMTESNNGDVSGRQQATAATWIVKLLNPANALTLSQPTYTCSTGAITFNTTGGDGTPVTYLAPGIRRASLTDNVGEVEQGLRNDPKPITIQATQSGRTVSYTFDFKAYCSNSPQILPPVVDRPIPILTVRINSGRWIDPFVISQYFRDPTQPFGTYKSNLRFSLANTPGQLSVNVPQGMYLADLSKEQSPYALIAGSPTVPDTYTVTVIATNLNLPPPANSISAPLIIQVISNPEFNFDGALALTQPDYDCHTGVIGFRLVNRATTDLSTITYTAPDVILSSATSSTGLINPGVLANPRPITIQATQSGTTVSYIFDLKAYSAAYCPNPGSNLTLLAPTYNCSTGAITFRTSGGDGSPIEFQSIGITGWTVNPNQFVDKESRTVSDVKPFTLMARQSGYVTTYSWDLKAACGRARVGAEEFSSKLSLTVLGNPVSEQVRVRLEGAEGQSVHLQLTDQTGRVLESRTIQEAGQSEEQVFWLIKQNAGLFLLRAVSNAQVSTVKIIKQ